jgi:hypothetical protein
MAERGLKMVKMVVMVMMRVVVVFSKEGIAPGFI